MDTDTGAKRTYVLPLTTRPGLLLFPARGKKHLGRVHFQAIALVIVWFALLLTALWSEIAVVTAMQRVINRTTFLHHSPRGHDGKPFR
jgi:hypothetical protein